MAITAHSLSYITQWILIISFLVYGASCLVSEKNRLEFERYQMLRFRKIVGLSQLAACAGLLLGFYIPWLIPLTALGLSVMMFGAVLVRLRIKDNALQTAPALFYFLLSLFLLLHSLTTLS